MFLDYTGYIQIRYGRILIIHIDIISHERDKTVSKEIEMKNAYGLSMQQLSVHELILAYSLNLIRFESSFEQPIQLSRWQDFFQKQ